MGAAQCVAEPGARGLWRCPLRGWSSDGQRLQTYRCNHVLPESTGGAPVAAREAKCFDDALRTLTKDLDRLVETRRKEQASVARKVNRLNDDNQNLSREVARLESLLLHGGCTDRIPAQASQVRAEVGDRQLANSQLANTYHASVEHCHQKQDTAGAGAEAAGTPSNAGDSTTPERTPPKDLQDESSDELGFNCRKTTGTATNVHRSSSENVLMCPMLRSVKLRTAWDELTDETVNAFSPGCNINVLDVHRRRSFGTKSEIQSRRRGSARLMATSQDEESLLSLCFFKSVLHPSSRPRLFWTMLTLIALLYDLITIPLSAFNLSDAVPAIGIVDLTFLIFWAIDIVMTFRTGYYAAGKVELRPFYIAVNYFKTWFFLDFFVVLIGLVSELAIMSTKPSALFRVARFFRILRILRLLRIAKLKQILEHIEDRINSNVMHLCLVLVKLVSGFGVVVHFCACTWYAVGSSTDNGWPTYDIWEGPKDLLFWYSASLRWTLAQVNGRTDMDERRNMRERMFTCLVAGGLAIILMAVFISSITAAMMELGSIAEERKKKVRRINEFLKKNQISSSLTALIKHHSFETKNIEETEEDDNEILSYLPRNIQSDLLYEIRAPLLLGHPLFNSITSESKKVTWQVCNDAMFPVISEKNAVLFDLNDSCTRMLLAVKGVLVYSTPQDDECHDGLSDCDQTDYDETRTGRIVDSSPISEAALWIEWHNCGRLRPTTPSYCVALSAPAFGEAVKQHLGAHARSIAYARAFVGALRDLEEMSDVMELRAYFNSSAPQVPH